MRGRVFSWLIVCLALAACLVACGDEDGAVHDPIVILDEEPEPTETMPGCGDGRCDAGESALSCPNDCPARCGDGVCTHAERASSCAADCPAVCGDMSCTHDESPFSCIDDCPPSHVNVTFLQFLVAPTKFDGCQWDGFTCGKPSGQQLEVISNIKTGNIAIDTLLSLYASGLFDSLDKPDVIGAVGFGPSGEWIDFDGGEDNFQVSVNNLSFFELPYREPFVFNYSILDEDLSNDDSIASGTLNKQDFDKILRSGYEGWITKKVHTASNGQLLGIFVSVYPVR